MKFALCAGAVIACVLVGVILGGLFVGFAKKVLKKDVSGFPVVVGAVLGVIAGVVACLIICSCIITVAPGYYAEAKAPDGTAKVLTSGSYNFVSPFEKVYKMEATSKAHKFSESEADDDIYGAQTKEKDYLTTVCNVNGRPDPERIREYIDTYGYVSFNDPRISEILKSQTRRAFEFAVNPQITEDVMSAKGKVLEEARVKALEYLADFPFIIDSLTFEEIRGSREYEDAVELQAQLRMKQATAELQKTVNEKEAFALAAIATGEKEALRIRAEGEAEAEKIKADKQNEIRMNAAENEKQIKQKEADADAYATRERAKAEADAIRETGEAYKANTSLMDLKLKEIEADVDKAWAEKWSGFVFDTGSGFTFTDLSDSVKTLIESGLGAIMPE